MENEKNTIQKENKKSQNQNNEKDKIISNQKTRIYQLEQKEKDLKKLKNNNLKTYIPYHLHY